MATLKNTKLFISLCSVSFLVSCGGGSSGSSSSASTPDDEEIPSVVVSKPYPLPMVSGQELVTDIQTLDLNEDGLPDLILARTSFDYNGSSFQALINKGDETFEDATETYFPNNESFHYQWTEKIYLADLNGDGKKDIFRHVDLIGLGTQAGFSNPPLLRQSDGSFAEFSFSGIPPIGTLIPIDVDNDGDIDLMTHELINFGDQVSQEIKWTLLTNLLAETGTFSLTSTNAGSITTTKGWDQPAFLYSPLVMDLNNDGFKDIFYTGPKWKNGGFVDESAAVIALINDGALGFSDLTNQIIPVVPDMVHPREVISADINGDTVNDIVIANHGFDGGGLAGGANAILLGNTLGTFSIDLVNTTSITYSGFTHSLDSGDIDNDGDIDLVLVDITGDDVGWSQKVRILKNDGSGKFTISFIAYPSVEPSVGVSDFWVSSKLVDLNNDGFLDLVVGSDDTKDASLIFWNNANNSGQIFK